MNKRTKTIQTGLNIAVKPISDQGMTEEEYRAKVADIQKQRQTQEALDKVAEEHFAQRRPRGPVQRRPTPRRVVPRVQPIRGLLAPEPRSSPFMGLLAIPVTGSKP
jgi:anti-sigma factor RsiW